MSRPTHILKHEHRIIEQVLRAMNGMCVKLKTGGTVPVSVLNQTLDFIQNFADRYHHSREETILFPALEQCGLQPDSGALSFLKSEHNHERTLLAELELAIEEYEYGDADAAERFISAAEEFSRHLSEHIQQEDTILFTLTEEMLEDEEREALAKSFASNDNQTSTDMRTQYEQLAAELEQAWSV